MHMRDLLKGFVNLTAMSVVGLGLIACSTPTLPSLSSLLGQTAQVTPIPIDVPLATQSQLRDFDAAVVALKQSYLVESAVGSAWQAQAKLNRDKIIGGMEDKAFLQLLDATLKPINDENVSLMLPETLVAASTAPTATYPGVGLIFALPEKDKDRVLVLYVYRNSPAERAGIRAHDAIVAIGGETVTVANYQTLIPRMRSEDGKSIQLRVHTPGQNERDVAVIPALIRRVSPLRYSILPNTDIGYIAPDPMDLASMRDASADALRAMQADRVISGLVLDLRIVRGNDFPINQMLGLFVNGEVGEIQRRNTKGKLEITGKSIAGSQDVPMVILVSTQTHGQAEAFASLLQDLGRARIVGDQTKGQSAFILNLSLPSSGYRLLIPAGEYVGVKKNSVYKLGVKPDVTGTKSWEEFSADDDVQLNQAIDLLKPH